MGTWLLSRPATGAATLLAGAESVDLRFIGGRASLVGGSMFTAMDTATRRVRLLLLDPQSPVAAAYDRSVPLSNQPSWVYIRDTHTHREEPRVTPKGQRFRAPAAATTPMPRFRLDEPIPSSVDNLANGRSQEVPWTGPPVLFLATPSDRRTDE